jgi:hypothetical protein
MFRNCFFASNWKFRICRKLLKYWKTIFRRFFDDFSTIFRRFFDDFSTTTWKFQRMGESFEIGQPVPIRVARCYILKPKIQNSEIFGVSWNGRSWYILWSLNLFYSHLVYFMSIWYILWYLGIFFHVSICCTTMKNLATLVPIKMWRTDIMKIYQCK